MDQAKMTTSLRKNILSQHFNIGSMFFQCYGSTLLMLHWKWNKIRHRFFNVAQRLFNVAPRRWNNVETMLRNIDTTLYQHCFNVASTWLKLYRNQPIHYGFINRLIIFILFSEIIFFTICYYSTTNSCTCCNTHW